MQSRIATRAAAITAAALLSMVVGAPSAIAATSKPDGAHDASAEHRQNDPSPKHEEENLDEPQPASNADFSGSGANQHGAYDSTRDGSPSENGNGDGTAGGKPCAGCVGNADNKNPPGQAPDGSDANNGYECDGNSGIGKTNPAHTGCATPDVPSVPFTPEGKTPLVPLTPTPTPTPTPVVHGTSLASSDTAAVAPRETAVLGISITAPVPATSVLGDAAPAALATTGASSLLMNLAATGVALVLGGLLLVWTRRRTSAPARA